MMCFLARHWLLIFRKNNEDTDHDCQIIKKHENNDDGSADLGGDVSTDLC